MEALPPPTDWRPARPGHPAWTVLAGAALVLCGLQVLVAAVALVAWEPWAAASTALWALGCWWVHRGAWLRTPRGRPAPDTPPPWSEPALTGRRARRYATLGAAAVLAAGLAVALQALVLAD